MVLDSPLPQLDRVFEYAIPDALHSQVRPGVRVKVPLRTSGRTVSGFVVGTSDEPEFAGKLAELNAVVSPAAVLTEPIYRLARAVADRQAGTVADVLRLAIPTRSARLEEQWLEQHSTVSEPDEPMAPLDPAEANGDIEREMRQLVPTEFLRATCEALLDSEPQRLVMQPAPGVVANTTAAFLQCLAVLAEVVRAGRSAIFCLPDFRDVELAIAAAERWLPSSRIRRFDARQKPKPRYHEFLRALEPRAQLIIGTRAAIYAPAYELGCIALWNDDDESFEEPRAPYAHTREVASIRATQSACGMLFASHAPSLAVTRLIELGWCIPWPAPRGRTPRVVPAAATLAEDPSARLARIPSAAWRAAKTGVSAGPVLVQVGRAGYLPGLACSGCGAVARCQNCHGPLAQTDRRAVPACTICGQLHGTWHCNDCGSTQLRSRGVGHERTAEELGRAFPNTPIIIADGARELVRITSTPALVVATRGAEPLAESGYRAVILLDTEGALARETLEAQTDAMRAWSNAAALVATDGTVVITGEQSAPVLALRDWQQPQLARAELAERYALGFPPAVRLVSVTGTRSEVDALLRRLHDLDLSEPQRRQFTVHGPTPDVDEPEKFRAIVRFAYSSGQVIASAAKAELVARATGSAKAGARGRRQSTLRVHFDAPAVF